jgi:hypothetical protein
MDSKKKTNFERAVHSSSTGSWEYKDTGHSLFFCLMTNEYESHYTTELRT